MQLDNIPVLSAITMAAGYMFLMGLIIPVSHGPAGEYLVEHQNRKQRRDQEQQPQTQASAPLSGVVGGCGNISEGTTVLSSMWLATG
jgi:hypothetical protein